MRSKYRKYTREDDTFIIQAINELGLNSYEVADRMNITSGMVNGRVRRLREAGFHIEYVSKARSKSKAQSTPNKVINKPQNTPVSRYPSALITTAIVIVTVFAMSLPFGDLLIT